MKTVSAEFCCRQLAAVAVWAPCPECEEETCVYVNTDDSARANEPLHSIVCIHCQVEFVLETEGKIYPTE